MPRAPHRPAPASTPPVRGTRDDLGDIEQYTATGANKLKQFSVPQRWAWAAERAFAVLQAAGDGFAGVLDPEGRGCCCIFALVSSLWPSVVKNGELYATVSAMKAHSSTSLAHGVPASERIVSCMIRELSGVHNGMASLVS